MDGIEYDDEKKALIKRTIAKGASDDELALFIAQCQRTGLDPFARQIYAVRRKQWDPDTRTSVEVQVIQVSIDGYRLIADRTNKYAGQVGPWWCGPDGEWVEVWLDEMPPTAAKVGVLRHDFKVPVFSVALFNAYAQSYEKNGQTVYISRWKTDPAGMLAKCAESLALRRAFPNELSGLYTGEEMDNVGEVVSLPGAAVAALSGIEDLPALTEGEVVSGVVTRPLQAEGVVPAGEPESPPEPELERDQTPEEAALVRARGVVTPSKKKTRLGSLRRDDLAKLVMSIAVQREEGKIGSEWDEAEAAAKLLLESPIL